MKRTISLVLAAALGACAATPTTATTAGPATDLGAFSVSLAVKDLAASLEFYRRLGFTEAGGNAAQHWLILRNGTATIGLFQGMFDKNTLTFNPGWSAAAEPLPRFEDVRAIQQRLEAQGLQLAARTDAAGIGPAYVALVDPDGNPVLIDQHVPKPQ